jgi:hypothetical protein
MRVLVGAWICLLVATSSVFALDDQEGTGHSGGGYRPAIPQDCASEILIDPAAPLDSIWPNLRLFYPCAPAGERILVTICDWFDAVVLDPYGCYPLIVRLDDPKAPDFPEASLPPETWVLLPFESSSSLPRWIDANGREVDRPRASGVYFKLQPGEAPKKVIHVR